MTTTKSESFSKNEKEYWLAESEYPDEIILEVDNFDTVGQFIACWKASMAPEGGVLKDRDEAFFSQLSDLCIDTGAPLTRSLHNAMLGLFGRHYNLLPVYRGIEFETELIRRAGEEAIQAAKLINQHLLSRQLEELEPPAH
jgi:hypothetical protein